MTRIVIHPGICGFTAIVEVRKISRRKVIVSIVSQCEKVSQMSETIKEMDGMEAVKPLLTCAIYQQAGEAKLHTSCPVPSGILKAIEVETGLALPKDISMHFEVSEDKGEDSIPM